MNNFYKYLPRSEEDEKWGLSILNAGCTRIAPYEQYPFNRHPHHHYFNWETGRILNEYQAIYIIRGNGFFESESICCTRVEEGSFMILFPGEWHRFKPDESMGWEEYWVGFGGEIADNLIRNEFFVLEKALIHIGVNEEILSLITNIIEHTREEKPGYQPLASGALLHLLGQIQAILKQLQFKGENNVEIIVNKARILLRQKIDEEVCLEDIAKELNVSYSWLRKMFKTYTGISLGQYFIQLKIEKAKILLSGSSKTIKEIAYELHFESCFYFSRLFKAKTALSPEMYRNKIGVKN